MTSELRRRLQLAREKTEKQRIEQQLTASGLHPRFGTSALPSWIGEERSRFYDSATRPDSSTPLASPDKLGRWIEEIAMEQGVTEAVTLATGLENFPWIDLHLAGSGWASSLIEAVGRNLTIYSAAKGILLVFFADEYEYLAFMASAAPGGDDTGERI
ncbi:hypothetical protein [Streptomyces sp. NPDC050848]|uniref:hypothetical protein n=1 Tax=Streptomyces sp. NPDC050848 TaxID=3155791 RepID=UPI0033E796FF